MRHGLLGRGAVERALVEDTTAHAADDPFELIWDACPLHDHVRRDLVVTMLDWCWLHRCCHPLLSVGRLVFGA
jgi:hypothetical protein